MVTSDSHMLNTEMITTSHPIIAYDLRVVARRLEVDAPVVKLEAAAPALPGEGIAACAFPNLLGWPPPHNATGKLPTLSAYAGGAPRASAQGRMSTSGNLSTNSSLGMVAVEDWDVLGAGWAGSGSAGDTNSSRRTLQVRGWVLPEG